MNVQVRLIVAACFFVLACVEMYWRLSSRMRHTIGITAAVLLVAGAPALGAGSQTPCPAVAAIKQMPFRDERGIDAAYDRLRFDAACETVLIESLRDLQKMPDPRQMPPESRFVAADAALFILLERRSWEVEQVLPEEVSARLKDQGIAAYFDYVATPAGRSAVAARIKRLLDGPSERLMHAALADHFTREFCASRFPPLAAGIQRAYDTSRLRLVAVPCRGLVCASAEHSQGMRTLLNRAKALSPDEMSRTCTDYAAALSTVEAEHREELDALF